MSTVVGSLSLLSITNKNVPSVFENNTLVRRLVNNSSLFSKITESSQVSWQSTMQITPLLMLFWTNLLIKASPSPAVIRPSRPCSACWNSTTSKLQERNHFSRNATTTTRQRNLYVVTRYFRGWEFYIIKTDIGTGLVMKIDCSFVNEYICAMCHELFSIKHWWSSVSSQTQTSLSWPSGTRQMHD